MVREAVRSDDESGDKVCEDRDRDTKQRLK